MHVYIYLWIEMKNTHNLRISIWTEKNTHNLRISIWIEIKKKTFIPAPCKSRNYLKLFIIFVFVAFVIASAHRAEA